MSCFTKSFLCLLRQELEGLEHEPSHSFTSIAGRSQQKYNILVVSYTQAGDKKKTKNKR